MTLWLAALWARIWKYVVALGALLLTVFGIYEKGRMQGKAVQVKINETAQVKANAKAVEQINKIQESRNETDAVIAALPVAPPQTVATADPKSAAGKLRDDGWVRPDDGS